MPLPTYTRKKIIIEMKQKVIMGNLMSKIMMMNVGTDGNRMAAQGLDNYGAEDYIHSGS